MSDKRAGFTHLSNKMRTKWEEGVQRNLEELENARANLKMWAEMGRWETDPEYMRKLELKIKRQEQYLRNRFGEA